MRYAVMLQDYSGKLVNCYFQAGTVSRYIDCSVVKDKNGQQVAVFSSYKIAKKYFEGIVKHFPDEVYFIIPADVHIENDPVMPWEIIV